MPKQEKVFETILTYYAESAEVERSISVMADLTRALCRAKMYDWDFLPEKRAKKIQKKIAEVEIMMAQLRLIFDGDDLGKEKKRKLIREVQRADKEI